MDLQTFGVACIVFLLLGGIYSTYRKSHQVYCEFEGEDGTIERKWENVKKGYVVFRDLRFELMPERMSTMLYKGGIHFFFPLRASCLLYTWESGWPRDPRNKWRTSISPRVRNVINTQQMLESYFKTSSPATASKKQTFIEKYLPYIIVIVVIIGGYYLYSTQQGMMQVINMMQQQINTLVR